MKNLSHDMRYDGATIDEVAAMLRERDFRDAVCAYQRYTRRDVTITPNGEGMSVRIDQFRPADEVPSFAKKLVGSEINILQEEEWSSATDGTLSVTIPGKPGARAYSALKKAFADGLLIRTTGDIIALSPPLILGRQHVDELFGKLAALLKNLD